MSLSLEDPNKILRNKKIIKAMEDYHNNVEKPKNLDAELKDACHAFLNSIYERYPGEDLRCKYMIRIRDILDEMS